MTPDEIARLVEAAGESLATEMRAAGEELSSWHPAEQQWCAKEVLGHLFESERSGFAGRIAEIIAARPGIEPLLKASGPLSRTYCTVALDELLNQFLVQRRRNVDFVRDLRREDLQRAGIHERVGRVTVNDLLHEWVHHDRAHVMQILTIVQTKVWPQMGNAQKFSG